jgi:hypothetical protein
MITLIHLLVGAVIGKYVTSIILIIVLALASHYVLDFIPHYSPSAPAGKLTFVTISRVCFFLLLKQFFYEYVKFFIY